MALCIRVVMEERSIAERVAYLEGRLQGRDDLERRRTTPDAADRLEQLCNHLEALYLKLQEQARQK